MNETIVRNIKNCADKKGMNIAQLEVASQIGNGTIGKWKSGKNNPSLRVLEKIAKTLDVKVSVLLGKA